MGYKDWYALQVEYGSELLLEQTINIEQADVIAYCPVGKRSIKSRHQKSKPEVIIEPIFKQWLFIYFLGPENWGNINSYRKAQGFLSVGGVPLPIRDRVIERIKRESDAGSYNDKLSGSNWREGDAIRISGDDNLFGQLFGQMAGKFRKLDGMRAIVEFNLMGRETVLHVPTELLEKIL